MAAEAWGEIDVAAELGRIRRALEGVDTRAVDPEGDSALLVALSDGPVQQLLGAAVRVYAACRERDAGVGPVDPAAPPTATEVLMAVSALLEAVEVEPFELGLWTTWGIRGGSGDAGAGR